MHRILQKIVIEGITLLIVRIKETAFNFIVDYGLFNFLFVYLFVFTVYLFVFNLTSLVDITISLAISFACVFFKFLLFSSYKD